MNQAASIEHVSDTAFWVAYFRAKENARAQSLFHDPYAQKLAGARGKAFAESAPRVSFYTEWTVIARTVIIDRFIERAISEGIDAIINLGAGLDARPYRMNLPQKLRWIEADYAKLIDYKTEVLRDEQPKCALTRISVDLADTQARQQFLQNVVPDAKSVLILTEGVIPYLSLDEVAVLAQELFAQQRFRYWVTEFIRKDVYKYLQSAAREGELQKTPFQFFPEEWYPFFAKFGWVEKETRFNSEIAAEFNRTIPMPLIGRIIVKLLPKRVREQALQSSGFVVFKRNDSNV
ncbi:MAG: SAM-dependent methyltransferase [Spongiibacteraceae bacterium]